MTSEIYTTSIIISIILMFTGLIGLVVSAFMSARHANTFAMTTHGRLNGWVDILGSPGKIRDRLKALEEGREVDSEQLKTWCREWKGKLRSDIDQLRSDDIAMLGAFEEALKITLIQAKEVHRLGIEIKELKRSTQ